MDIFANAFASTEHCVYVYCGIVQPLLNIYIYIHIYAKHTNIGASSLDGIDIPQEISIHFNHTDLPIYKPQKNGTCIY